jgi:hypothetical protein
MFEPIEANYVPEGDDWAVAVTGRGQTLTAKAPGLIAARDRADQLVEKLAPDEEHHTVVHRINGDPVEFTDAYLHARLDMPMAPTSGNGEDTSRKQDEPAEEKGPVSSSNGKSTPNGSDNSEQAKSRKNNGKRREGNGERRPD